MADHHEKLLRLSNELASSLSPDRARQLASQIRDVEPREASRVAVNRSGSAKIKDLIEELVSIWSMSAVSGSELAGMLLAASYIHTTVASREAVELVWTGPSSKFVPMRKTEQVLLEVIRSSEKELFLTSFVALEVPSIVDGLADAIARGVSVSLLLESSKEYGGDLKGDSIATMRKSLPGADIYYLVKNQDGSSPSKVHAKVAVADDSTCFVTSANLTGLAMKSNIEAGILLRGGPLPRELHEHLKALVATALIRRVRF